VCVMRIVIVCPMRFVLCALSETGTASSTFQHVPLWASKCSISNRESGVANNCARCLRGGDMGVEWC
jgi:hypothetical protein